MTSQDILSWVGLGFFVVGIIFIIQSVKEPETFIFGSVFEGVILGILGFFMSLPWPVYGSRWLLVGSLSVGVLYIPYKILKNYHDVRYLLLLVPWFMVMVFWCILVGKVLGIITWHAG